MQAKNSPLTEVGRKLASGESAPESIAREALGRANSNVGRNVYIAADSSWTLSEAQALRGQPVDSFPLYGIPVSLKDCFDLAGFPTSCGSLFYSEAGGIAAKDSSLAARLRQAGAVITGKTHLHQLAYGITGENPDYGDCAQPGNAKLLTGGSSSGAAASVQEGSAMAAIGTDTGGSIRVPAALCGLAGYRSSYGLADSLGLWDGGTHLAPTFDTLGWLFRDPRDGPLLAQALFGLAPAKVPSGARIGCVNSAFLQDCEPAVLRSFEQCKSLLQREGATIETFSPGFWSEGVDIFAPIQAHEAAAIHRGSFHHFDRGIAERLTWGASIGEQEMKALRSRHLEFRSRMDALLSGFDSILLPAAPMRALARGADHSGTRNVILRYTVPVSLAGMPAVTLPGEGGGMQLAAARGNDAELLAFASALNIGGGD